MPYFAPSIHVREPLLTPPMVFMRGGIPIKSGICRQKSAFSFNFDGVWHLFFGLFIKEGCILWYLWEKL